MSPAKTAQALVLSATIAIGVLGLWAPNAWAHRPVFSSPPHHASDATALRLPDIDVSRAIYRRAPNAEPFWLSFEGHADATLRLQLGVPRIDRLSSYRPTATLRGPGLPSPDSSPLALDLSESQGARVFRTEGVATPRTFHEPITGTTSWVLLDSSVHLPEAGRYELIVQAAEPGRHWVSVGHREAFGLADMAKLPGWTERVRAFHEVGGWPAWMTIGAVVLGLLAMGGIWIGARSL